MSGPAFSGTRSIGLCTTHHVCRINIHPFSGLHRSRQLIQESDQHLKDIEKTLQKDKRYLILDCVADERKDLIMEHCRELSRKGPPPPPTASEPSRRSIMK